MRHRLYYLLPDVSSARSTLDDMLLNRIEQKHIHFINSGAPMPPDLPEGNVFHKTDMLHGAGTGMFFGAVLGLLAGIGIVLYFNLSARPSEAAVVILTTLGGLLFGGWAASMVAAAIPNTRLKAFYPDLEKGSMLMIADVPARRVTAIEKMLAERHPETRFRGEEPNMPVFP